MARPRRLDSFDYRGPHVYFLTFCLRARSPHFADPGVVRRAESQILRTARERDFEMLAYTFMPDHCHLLVQGTTDEADLRRFVQIARQRVTFALNRGRLWQDGYFERTLRRDEDAQTVARYIADNPVRAALVERAADWPHSGGVLLDALWGATCRTRPT